MTSRFNVLSTLLFGATAGIIAFGTASVADAQEATKLNVITANDTTCSLYPEHISEILGMNADQGVEVTLLSSETTVPYVAFLSNGDAEIVMLDSAQVLQMANVGQDASVIYVTHQFAPEGIVVVADSPVQSLTDLRGTVIGMASDRDQITTIIALDSVGVDISEVTTVVVGDSGPVMASSLTSGKIAAFAGGSSDRSGIEAAGVAIRNITPSAVSDNPGNSFAMQNSRKQELDGAIQGYLKAWAMAQHTPVVDLKLAAAICREAIPEQFENMETGLKMVSNSAFITQLRRTKDYGEVSNDVWARIQPTMIKLGEIDGFIEPSTFTDSQYIAAANAWTTADVKGYLNTWRINNPTKLIP